MSTITLTLDDDLASDFAASCARQQRDAQSVVAELLQKYINAERLKQTLSDPALVKLYEELADEDVALAEEGIAGFQDELRKATTGM